ncbi:MAG: endo-1,4-beta-xylanase [Oscillospiraceae bacterium]|nr:endo-1,4-beta-xylanase [Oscillospiraceae bacterium]
MLKLKSRILISMLIIFSILSTTVACNNEEVVQPPDVSSTPTPTSIPTPPLTPPNDTNNGGDETLVHTPDPYLRGVLPEASADSLRGAYAEIFEYMGAATYNEHYANLPSALQGNSLEFIKEHYNSITAENEMKQENVFVSTEWSWETGHQKASLLTIDAALERGYVVPDGYEDAFVPEINFKRIENFIKIAYEEGLSVRYHALIWHSQVPKWFYIEDYKDEGNLVSQNIMNKRIEYFIKTVLKLTYESPYGDAVYSWDVVNEFFSNYNTELYKIYNNTDVYVINAFNYAHEQLVEMGIRSEVSLILNEAQEQRYVDRMVNLVNKINDGGVIRCDGVGLQGHYSIGSPTISDIAKMIDSFSNAGFEIHYTEIDVAVRGSQTLEDQATYYGEFFSMLVAKKKEGANITSITFWGLFDSGSWLEAEKPLLFSDIDTPKPAFYAVIDAASK